MTNLMEAFYPAEIHNAAWLGSADGKRKIYAAFACGKLFLDLSNRHNPNRPVRLTISGEMAMALVDILVFLESDHQIPRTLDPEVWP